MLMDGVVQVLLGINVIFAIILVFFERKDPRSALAWLLVLFLLPTVGFVLYLIFGQNYFRQRRFTSKARGDYSLHQRLIEQEEGRIDRNRPFPAGYAGRFHSLITMLLENGQAPLTTNNRVRIFTDGKEMLDSLLSAIEGARHHIHMEYFSIQNNEYGKRIVAALARKAREGVEVRVIFDTMGSLLLPFGFFADLSAAGGRVTRFYSSVFLLLPLRINYRDHRKITVIDGSIGYIGGSNLGDKYAGRLPGFSPWRDTNLRIEGGAVRFLQLRFIQDWRFAAGEDLLPGPYYFPVHEPGEGVPIQIVSSGPDMRLSPIKEAYLKLINSARTSIAIQTPYFVPDESVTDALRIAALSGVDVRVMIPDRPDHPFVYWSTFSHIADLLEVGVRVYTYGEGFLHAKTIVVDGHVASVGSANWDVRSFRLNFEVNALLYGEQSADELHRIFLDDITRAREITPQGYASRSAVIRIKESVSRLLSPIL
jgi:cardiolipin synthase